jgi:hypothetical protein
MREVTVHCGDVAAPPEPGRRGALTLDVDAHEDDPARVNLGLSHITRRMVEDLPDRLVGLLEIACYAYCADQFVPRDSELMPRMGAFWRRGFSFHLAVRDLEFWEREDVRALLASTLGFLSEDRFGFTFERSRRRAPIQQHLDLLDDGPPSGFDPDRVVLFSGGLDSFAGAAEAVLERCERVALVSHQASPLVASKQAALVGALRRRARRGLLFHVGVAVNKGGADVPEFTQRTRSFLFATLGFVVARLFRKAEVAFFENGVVSRSFTALGAT